MNSNHQAGMPKTIEYSIIGTVSPSSLGTGDEAPTEHVLNVWADYLAEKLKAALEDVKDVEIKIAPFGGTRLVAVGDGLMPDQNGLQHVTESIFTDFCFNYDKIVHHGMTDGFAKSGDEEC